MKQVFNIILLIFFSYSSCTYIDLTHTLSSKSPYFPTQTRFNFTNKTEGWTENNYFYSSNSYQTSEHIGTHLDAPYHFSNVSWTVDQIPIDRLISVDSLIIDVSKQCQQNKNYEITINDIKQYEPIKLRRKNIYFIILFYTGWTAYWTDQLAYAGVNSKEDSLSGLEFPGLSREAAEYLVKTYAQKLVGIGIDTLSIDSGQSKEFYVHQIILKHNIYALENVAALDIVLKQLYKSKSDLILYVFPMKIEKGSGAQCRIIADVHENGFDRFDVLILLGTILVVLFCGKIWWDWTSYERNFK